MAASSADAVDQEFAQFRGQLRQFWLRQPAQISRNVDGLEEGVLAWWCFCHLPQFIPSRPGLVMGCGACSGIATGAECREAFALGPQRVCDPPGGWRGGVIPATPGLP